MKEKGIVRHIDPLGRLVIPKELRLQHGMVTGSPVEILSYNGMICIRRYKPSSNEILLEALCMLCDDTGKDPREYIEKAREKRIDTK